MYSSTAALPAFCVRYKLLNHQMPNPYTADTASRGSDHAQQAAVMACGVAAEYLRSLRDVPPLLQVAGGSGAGVEGALEIEDDAKLLPMGSFPTTRAAAVELRRKVRAEGFSAAETVSIRSSKEELWRKVCDLTKEIEWLKSQLGELQEVEAENMALKVARLAEGK